MRHPSEQHKKQASKNFTLLVILFATVIFFGVLTYIKMSGQG
jgi:hypothetical protein